MMELHCSNGRILDYHGLQSREKTYQAQAKTPVINILFDESHGELLQSESSKEDASIFTHNELDKLLKENFKEANTGLIAIHAKDKGSITAEILEKYQILVLAAPTELFSLEEVEAITQFVLDGNCLLVAASSRSLCNQLDKRATYDGQDINSLLKSFGLQFKELLNSPSEEITELHPHFLTSEINRLFVNEPSYLEILPEVSQDLPQPPRVLANLPHTHEPCLATSEPVYRARIVAISDFIIFADDYLIDGNKQLALNIFRWLAFENQLDCFATAIDSEIQYGEAVVFSISLSNSHGRRLEYISGLLESEAGTEILDAQEKNIRSLAPYAETELRWTIKPTRLGLQKLKLTIDCLKEPTFMPLFFDVAAQFKCIPDVEFDLVICNSQGEVSDVVETGKPISVKVGLRPKSGVPSTLMQFKLTSPASELVVETVDQSSPQHWRLSSNVAGDYPITLVVAETGQRVSRLVRICPSIQNKISSLEKDTVARLDQEIYRQIEALQSGLDVKEVRQIPFRLLTPEEYVELLHPGRTDILDIIRAARKETRENQRLVESILNNIFPLYSPLHRCCCIPYDPQLAAHLLENHPDYQEYLAEAFLCLGDDDQTNLEQNLAALILHEKYGHGFFFTQTTLGKQLSILFKYGLYPDSNSSQLKSPYPRLLYEEYKPLLQELWKSVTVFDEGFATWIELTILPRLPGITGQGAFRRKVFLFNDAERRYQPGYEYFQFIYEAFDTKVVTKVMLEASDIDLGVIEEGGKVRFALDSKTLLRALQGTSRGSTISASERLEQIHAKLCESSQKYRVKQEQVDYSQTRVYSDTLISTLIRDAIK